MELRGPDKRQGKLRSKPRTTPEGLKRKRKGPAGKNASRPRDASNTRTASRPAGADK
jgi:hypothetical protein